MESVGYQLKWTKQLSPNIRAQYLWYDYRAISSLIG
eukprot:COSAG02_NODE_53270_length_303_cov_0.504902_1_plen_35_part_10